jgi:putative redox protein
LIQEKIMEARVKWIEGRTFLGETGSGHAVVMAGSSLGKEAVGPSPMELILLGLGGCATYDVIHILERGRQDIADCDVEISSERSQEDPRCSPRFTFISKSRAPV